MSQFFGFRPQPVRAMSVASSLPAIEESVPEAPFGEGPYHLSAQALDSIVARKCPRTFVLGEQSDDGFHVDYVGRSDTDENARLRGHVGKYRHFRFDYTSDAKATFEEECALYHDYRPDHNPVHPEPPVGLSWGCPRCKGAKPAAV